MLPILSLFGLAIATIFMPDSQADPDDGSNNHHDYVSDQKTASQSYDTATESDVGILDTLSFADEATGSFLDETTDDDQMIGTDDDDALWGLDGNDSIWGDAGSDTLFGGAGDDFLFGDDDAEGDELMGGDGNDTVFAGEADRVTLGAGDDVVKAAADATIHVSDFNPDDDRIEVIYEEETEPPTLKTVETDTGIQLTADESVVAVLDGIYELDLNAVKLIAA